MLFGVGKGPLIERVPFVSPFCVLKCEKKGVGPVTRGVGGDPLIERGISTH